MAKKTSWVETQTTKELEEYATLCKNLGDRLPLEYVNKYHEALLELDNRSYYAPSHIQNKIKVVLAINGIEVNSEAGWYTLWGLLQTLSTGVAEIYKNQYKDLVPEKM